MKNFIPLVIAVLLGLAATLAVGRLLRERARLEEDTVMVVAAARDITENDALTDNSIMQKEVPLSARPAQAIFWSRSDMVAGQRALRSIAQGDYILLSDVGLSRSMGDIVGEGEWAVTLHVAAGGIADVVQPGDEVAVMGTFKIKTTRETADLSAKAQTIEKEATLVLFPRVRVLSVGQKNVKEQSEGNEIIVALPPRQAQVLIASQRRASLTLALRRPGDDAAISRMDAGMVDESTFDRLLKGLEPVVMPEVPGVVGRKRVAAEAGAGTE